MNLNQVTIYSARISEAVEFYKTLGFILIVDSFPRYVRFECPDGDSTLSLHETDEKVSNNSVVLYFECPQLDKTVESLIQAGIEFQAEPVDQPWLWREAKLRDPDGNPIILFSAGENRKNPPWRV